MAGLADREAAMKKLDVLRVSELRDFLLFCQCPDSIWARPKAFLLEKARFYVFGKQNIALVCEKIEELHKRRFLPTHIQPNLPLGELAASAVYGGRLPFFEMWEILVHPTLTPVCDHYLCCNLDKNRTTLKFKVPKEQALRAKADDQLQILLLFMQPKSSEDGDSVPYKHDPEDFWISINGKHIGTQPEDCWQPKYSSLPPLDITSHCSLLPDLNENVLILTQKVSRADACRVSVVMGRRKPPIELVGEIKSRTNVANDGRCLVKKMFSKQKKASDVTLSSGDVLLTCPLTATRLVHPGRAKSCLHLQCFDICAFLQMTEGRAKWFCPICKKAANFEDLVIDSLVIEILSATPNTVNRVEFCPDGSWKPVKSQPPKRSGTKRASSFNGPLPGEEGAKRAKSDSQLDSQCIDLTVDESTSAPKIDSTKRQKKRRKGDKKQHSKKKLSAVKKAIPQRLGSEADPIILD